jgi:hypothetical protein
MIKTNIKMRVTPEQSAKVQEICFENGIFWNASTRKDVLDTRGKFLYIENTITHDVPWENGNDIIEMEDFFKKNDLLEINPDFFIRTNGTCIEKEEFTYPMWFESKTTKEVVRFDGLNKGEVIVSKNKAFPVGFYSLNVEPHTSIIWKQIENPNLTTDKNNNKAKNQKSKHYELWEDFEAIDVIKLVLTEEEYRGFLKGNILKYQLRLGKKDEVLKEIEKIEDYQRELKNEN